MARKSELAELRRRMRCWEAAGREERRVSGGPLERLLPGGFRRGALVEWLGPAGGGAGTLALWAARQACREGGVLVVIDPLRQFYPPAAAAWGINLDQLVLIRPANERDELWAWDQALRCPAVGSVWGSVQRLEARPFRRLQLAAEAGGTLGLLVRPEDAHGPSWAEAQLKVRPLPQAGKGPPSAGRTLRVEAVRRRGGEGGTVRVFIDEAGVLFEASDETSDVHLVPRFAE